MRLALLVFCGLLSLATLSARGGTEPLPRDVTTAQKEITTSAPPVCDWRGFHIGANGGGVFGSGAVEDVDDFNMDGQRWSYDLSGFSGGVQIGYDWQQGAIAYGLETDAGYLGAEGDGAQPASPGHDTIVRSEEGFFATARARVGFSFLRDRLLAYGTAGGITSNADVRVSDDCATGNCGPMMGSGSSNEFRIGWTAGGGLEYALSCHWSVRAEYLYYKLEEKDVDFHERAAGRLFHFDTGTRGNLIRAGLNYRF